MLNKQIYDPFAYLKRAPEFTNVRTGQIFTFFYKYFQNDRIPLALIIMFEPQYSTFLSINLNYLDPATRSAMFESWINTRYNIKFDEWFITMQDVYNVMGQPSVCIRRYKAHGIQYPVYVKSDDDYILNSIGDMDNQTRQQLYMQSKMQMRIGLGKK